MCDGAADCTCERESRVQREAAQLLWLLGLDGLLDSIELDTAGRGWRSCCTHCAGVELVNRD